MTAKRSQRKNTYFHVGDLGDIVAALPVIRQLGGGYLILGNRNGRGARELMTQTRYDAIAPLLLAQDYITGVHLENDPPAEKITHDFVDFRDLAPPKGCNLATWQAAYLGVDNLDQSPWLRVEPSAESEGMAIFARTTRYQDYRFDWREVVRRHAGQSLFVGHYPEYEAFIKIHEVKEWKVRFRPTENLLEVAQLIAGCKALVSNQTCAFWIGAGLAVPLVQETDVFNYNSIVPRDNAVYLTNGVVDDKGNQVWDTNGRLARADSGAILTANRSHHPA